MTLARYAEFKTDDPLLLREDLRREHADIFAALEALNFRRPWTVIEVGEGQTVTAEVDQALAGTTFTVRPPKNARPGDCFRVIRVGAGGTITITPDDGTTVQGVASETVVAPDVREYQWVDSDIAANRGWWHG